MTTVLLVGVGAVGARAARQLVDTPGIDRLLLTDPRERVATEVAAAMGGEASAIRWQPGEDLPDDVAAVAVATPHGEDLAVARAAIAARIPCATSTDDHDAIRTLLELDESAQRSEVPLAIGCGLAPGLGDVLARHAADALDSLDEIDVARAGTAGPASVATMRHALRGRSVEWRDRAWAPERRRAGRELVWFPDPIGAQECAAVGAGIELLVDAFPQLERASVRLGEPPGRRSFLQRGPDEGAWGAVRVEAHGHRGQARETIVYGAIERTAIAAGTVLGVTTAQLAGALGGSRPTPIGAHGLGTVVEPGTFLAELARRGVRAAVFEGVAVA